MFGVQMFTSSLTVASFSSVVDLLLDATLLD